MGLLSNFRHKFHNAFFTQVLYGTVASLAIFLTSWDHLDRMRDRLQTKLQNDTDTFDFIIVGAGTAGSVVAHRLSQYYSVLLLEAGGEPNPFQAVPGLALFMPNHPEIDWMHRSVPQKRAFGNSLKREASLSQGKGLGGSGNLNFLNYLRGSPLDYEHWKNITADPSWGYSEMRKYFQLVEDYTKDPTQKSRGTVKLDIPDYVGLSAEFITAGDQLGYKHVDLNDNFVEGFDVNYFPIYKGIRQAPYQSYLKTARGRKSLTIRKFSHVNRILFRDNSTQAYGVEYERHGETKVAKAAKEVILSAGALSTPKILMLSGVGPSEHLQDIGIPLRLNLPVGRNLQDHISTLLGPFLIKEPRSLLVGKDIDTGSFLEWGMDGKGPLTTSFYQASALLLSDFAKSREEDLNWPDIHLQLSSVGIHKTYAQDLAHAYNLQENLLTQYYAHAAGKQSFSISVTNGRPVGRGEVLLSGREVKDKLIINPKYLEDSYGLDVKILKDGVQTALKLAENTTAFQKVGARFTDKQLPGCEHVEFRSDAYWECYIRQFSLSMHAYCGTAAMGKATSKYAVVDPELKIIGAKGLRVVDASVMPSIVVGSPQGAILALAEKGAASILQYWRQFDVPSKLYDEDEERRNATLDANNDFTDSFSGFSYLGKVTRVQSKTGGSANGRKIQKQKATSTTTVKPQPSGHKRHGNRVVVTTRAQAPVTTTAASTTVSTSKLGKSHKQEIFEQAETFFSHNLNQIMEFLRNSRAIDEKLDDETYNDLVQNFGDRIAGLMKNNKTDIFFIPVTTTSTTVSPSTTLITRRPSSGKVEQTPSPKNSFSSKYSEKPQSAPTQKNGKPFQYSTTAKPTTSVTQKLATYQLNEKNLPGKSKLVTTSVPKKLTTSAPSSSFSFSSGGKKLIESPSKFSTLISQVSSAKSATTAVPKKITTSFKPATTSTTSVATSKPTPMSIDTLFNHRPSTEEDEEEEVEEEEETTVNPENPTHKPMEISIKPSKKIVELILNPDLSINKTKEIDSETFKSLTTSSGGVLSTSDSSKSKERELIEYRTEEVRPFPNYPPYNIVNIPGHEFVPGGGRLLPPSPHHSSPSHQFIPSISSPSILFPPSGLTSLTPPPPQQTLLTPHGPHQLPRLHNFQQAQLLAPPKLPSVIDENLPIQTAKTVLYYTQVYPRDPNDITRHANIGVVDPVAVTGEGRLVSSSASLSLPFQREDQQQNIVQFFPSIH